MRKLFLSLLSLFVLLGASSSAFAVKILAIKEGRVLLDLEGSNNAKGDDFLVSDANGKHRALIQIAQIKGGRAVAHILKGNLTAAPGSYSLASYSPRPRTKVAESARSRPIPPRRNRTPHAWGALLGLSQNSMKVNLSSSSSVQMSGSSFNLEGFYQQPLDGQIEVLGRFGYDDLQAKGTANTTAVCDAGQCKVNIAYLGFDGVVRYSYRQPKYNLWVGGGLGFLFALSKSSNVIDTSKVSTNQKVMVTGGLDWNLNRRAFVPLSFDYAIFPNKSTVTTNQIILRVGYGLRY